MLGHLKGLCRMAAISGFICLTSSSPHEVTLCFPYLFYSGHTHFIVQGSWSPDLAAERASVFPVLTSLLPLETSLEALFILRALLLIVVSNQVKVNAAKSRKLPSSQNLTPFSGVWSVGCIFRILSRRHDGSCMEYS